MLHGRGDHQKEVCLCLSLAMLLFFVFFLIERADGLIKIAAKKKNLDKEKSFIIQPIRSGRNPVWL